MLEVLTAGVILFGLGYVYSPLARFLGGVVATLGAVALVQGSPWGLAALAAGAWLWLVGSWTFTIHHPRKVSSRAARVLFVHTPLAWLLPAK